MSDAKGKGGNPLPGSTAAKEASGEESRPLKTLSNQGPLSISVSLSWDAATLVVPVMCIACSSIEFLRIFGMVSITVLFLAMFLSVRHAYYFPGYLARVQRLPVFHQQHWLLNGMKVGIDYSWWVAFPCGLLLAFVSTIRLSAVEISGGGIGLACLLVVFGFVVTVYYNAPNLLTIEDCIELNGDAYETAILLLGLSCLTVILYRFCPGALLWLSYYFY